MSFLGETRRSATGLRFLASSAIEVIRLFIMRK